MPANENLNEDWIDMNEPGVSPSRDVLADENSDEDSNESCCGTLDDSSLSSGSDHSNNELVDSLIEMEGRPSGNSQILACECSDPTLWPSVLSDEHRKIVVEKGPCRTENYKDDLWSNTMTGT